MTKILPDSSPSTLKKTFSRFRMEIMAEQNRITPIGEQFTDKEIELFCTNRCHDQVGNTVEHLLADLGNFEVVQENGHDLLSVNGVKVEVKTAVIGRSIKDNTTSYSASIANLDGKNAEWVFAIIYNQYHNDLNCFAIPHEFFKHKQSYDEDESGNVVRSYTPVSETLGFFGVHESHEFMQPNWYNNLMQFYVSDVYALATHNLKTNKNCYPSTEWRHAIKRTFELRGHPIYRHTPSEISDVISEVKYHMSPHTSVVDGHWLELDPTMHRTLVQKPCHNPQCDDDVPDLRNKYCTTDCRRAHTNDEYTTKAMESLNRDGFTLLSYDTSKNVNAKCNSCGHVSKLRLRTKEANECQECVYIKKTHDYQKLLSTKGFELILEKKQHITITKPVSKEKFKHISSGTEIVRGVTKYGYIPKITQKEIDAWASK